MNLSDSMFLFEIIVESIKSYTNQKEFYLRGKFADIFNLILKNPRDLNTLRPKSQKKSNKTTKLKTLHKTKHTPTETGKLQTGQSFLLNSTIDTLISYMKQFPIELSVWDKKDINHKLGSICITWNSIFMNYLNQLQFKKDLTSAYICDDYNVFDELTSKRMANVRLNIKLTYLADRIQTSFRSFPEDNKSNFMDTTSNIEPTTKLKIKEERQLNKDIWEDKRTVKSIYSSENRQDSDIELNYKNEYCKRTLNQSLEIQSCNCKDFSDELSKTENSSETRTSRLSLIRSDSDLGKSMQISLIETKSCSTVYQDQYKIWNKILEEKNASFGNQVYCVRYFSVENDFNRDTNDFSDENSTIRQKLPKTEEAQFSEKTDRGAYNESGISSDILNTKHEIKKFIQCQREDCEKSNSKNYLQMGSEENVVIDIGNAFNECCKMKKVETLEQMTGGMKMKFNEDSCLCSCECKFGFVKTTKYCNVCGGYERPGEVLSNKSSPPFPCPVYHNLIDKNKLKTLSTSGSDTKKKGGDDSQKSFKVTNKPSSTKTAADKTIESSKDNKKGNKKERQHDKFSNNYGYVAPTHGHSQCFMGCQGPFGGVPKTMGWLWTADNVPGMRFRPMWKPGATNKHVVHLLRVAKDPATVITKKKKKDMSKKRRPLKRPMLIVEKKDGEYIVTMETMKHFPPEKPRALNQNPYEDKPVVAYTVGRTEDENRERKRKRERQKRRLERNQRDFIQSTFRDMCEEICVKTYQQALGILPNTENNHDCSCYPAQPDKDKTNLDRSCSCSEDNSTIGSETDFDEWVVEFTPPIANFDPTYKGKKIVKTDNSCQYSYLDYRVKFPDRFGIPVPRYFKGPDGKQQCSDLGGFWSPDHQWLEINKDGYIAPDGRWAPVAFIGPNRDQIHCTSGKFQVGHDSLVVGVDGYVDSDGKWRFYPKVKGTVPNSVKRLKVETSKKDDKNKNNKKALNASDAPWSCFGDASPKDLSKIGVVGHGQDKKLLLETLKQMLAHGEDVKIPQQSMVPRLAPKHARIKHVMAGSKVYDSIYKCKHPKPSPKGIVSVDKEGQKIYFKLPDFKNKRPKHRLANLKSQGISLSSFHEPCLRSFINVETMRKQLNSKLLAMSRSSKSVSTQMD